MAAFRQGMPALFLYSFFDYRPAKSFFFSISTRCCTCAAWLPQRGSEPVAACIRKRGVFFLSSAYTALYRRWRPQLFSEVVGQEHVTRTLQNALAADRVAHAYLFCGLRGTGKTTMAKLLAKALNCQEGVRPEPCNRCVFCREITGGRSMDVQEIDAASNRGIDEIRELREKVRYSPAQNRYKVYIIDEVHMLTNEAFNALLKTLEEPPPGVVFILATTETHKLPLTVVSRCQRFDFHLLETRQVAARLEKVAREMDFAIDEASLFLLARLAEGSLRDAMGFLEQCRAYGGEKIVHEEVLEILGLAAPEVIYRFMESVFHEDIQAGLAEIREIVFRGRDLHRFLKELLLYLRKLILLQVGEEEGVALEDVPALTPYLLEHKGRADHRVILEMLEIIQDLTHKLKGASQPHFLLELAYLKLVRAFRFRRYLDPAQLLSRLEELENGMQLAGASAAAEGRAGAANIEDSQEQRSSETGASSRGDAKKQKEAADDGSFSKGARGGQQPAFAPPTLEGDPGDLLSTVPFPAGEDEDPAWIAPGDLPVENQFTAAAASAGEQGATGLPPEEAAAGRDFDLQELWSKQVLPGLKKYRKTQGTYLQNYLEWTGAAPLSWKEGIFTVGVAPAAGKVLVKRLEDPENRDILTAVLTQLLGTPVELRFVVQEGAGKKPVPGEKNPHPAAAESPGLPGDEATGQRPLDPGEIAPGAAQTPGAQHPAQADYYIQEMVELFNGQLIQSNGEPPEALDSWSEPLSPPPGEKSPEDPPLF